MLSYHRSYINNPTTRITGGNIRTRLYNRIILYKTGQQPAIERKYSIIKYEIIMQLKKAIHTIHSSLGRLPALVRGILRLDEMLIHREIETIKNSPRYDEPKSLVRYGNKVYSQTDEDGIIREIFARIGTTNKTFVEFGIGNGLENNTLSLLFDDWNGLWIDASKETTKAIKTNLNALTANGQLKVVDAFITRDNINELILSNISETEIDLLSIDIDGNDYHVLDSITCIKPRVISIEYNAKFPPPLSYCMDYNASHVWAGDDCFGASLKFLEQNIHGYCLVGCNLSGANAFFIKEDLVANHFLEPFTAEKHYEPARYYLASLSSGHPASHKTLNTSLTTRST